MISGGDITFRWPMGRTSKPLAWARRWIFSLIWFDNFYIPADAPHVANAHKFIEFLLQPEVIAGVSNTIHYANSNLASKPFVNADIRDNAAIYPDPATMQRLFTQKSQSQAAVRLITRTWNAVKTGK